MAGLAAGASGSKPAEITVADADKREPVLLNARQYLNHYWPADLDSEDMFALQFLHDVYSLPEVIQHATAGSLVEVGGGPVIDKLISASACSGRIFHLDPSASARKEIELWKEASPQAYDWSSRFQYVSTLEQKRASGGSGRDDSCNDISALIEARLREALFFIGNIDLLSANRTAEVGGMISPELSVLLQRHPVTVVSSHCCIECITSSKDEYKKALDGLVSFCTLGSFLVMTVNVDTNEWYSCEVNISIPAFCISVESVLDELTKRGFSIIFHRLHNGKTKSEMPKTMAVLAKRTAKLMASVSSPLSDPCVTQAPPEPSKASGRKQDVHD